MSDVYIFGVPLKEILNWYLAQPLYGQILVLIGLVAVIALAVVILYYVIKGVAYLVYYILKGLYLLLKYIGLGFYKLTEGFYLLVSGKKKTSKPESSQKNIQNTISYHQNYILEYCSECGRKVSNRMKVHFEKNGITFCENCGKQLDLNHALKTITISH